MVMEGCGVNHSGLGNEQVTGSCVQCNKRFGFTKSGKGLAEVTFPFQEGRFFM
jgi:hypothetical protein